MSNERMWHTDDLMQDNRPVGKADSKHTAYVQNCTCVFCTCCALQARNDAKPAPRVSPTEAAAERARARDAANYRAHQAALEAKADALRTGRELAPAVEADPTPPPPTSGKPGSLIEAAKAREAARRAKEYKP